MLHLNDLEIPPAHYPRPLTERIQLSDGPRLCALLDRVLVSPDGSRITLDPWQVACLNHLLERFPEDWPDPTLAGRLRWRQAIISMGRQNGKSLLASALALYGLLQHSRAPYVLGVATSVEQATIVYERVRRVVADCRSLRKILVASGTRGIRWRDGRGQYSVRPSRSEGLQGLPVSLGIADELHIMREEVWHALVNGQRSISDALLLGITTAGDESSTLLKSLYAEGEAAARDPKARYGVFRWEASSEELTDRAIAEANPAVACGRIDVAQVRQDISGLPRADQVRYTLNRFVLASDDWLGLDTWQAAARTDIGVPDEPPIAIGVDRGPSYSWVTWVGAWRTDDGIYLAELASLRGMTEETARDATARLSAALGCRTVAGPTQRMRTTMLPLRSDWSAWILSNAEQSQAVESLLAAVAAGTVTHDGRPGYGRQAAAAKRHYRPDKTWFLRPGADGLDELGALIAAYAVAAREEASAAGLQIF